MDALGALFVTIIHDVFPLYAQEVKRQPLGSPTCLVLDYKVIYSFLFDTGCTYTFLLLNKCTAYISPNQGTQDTMRLYYKKFLSQGTHLAHGEGTQTNMCF